VTTPLFQQLLCALPRRLGFRRAALTLALLAALHSVAYLPFVEPHETADTPSYLAGARAIGDGGYSVPLGAVVASGDVDITGLPLEPAIRTAEERYTYRTPGYPLLLAVIGGGEDGASRAALFAVQVALYGAGVFLLALTARRLWAESTALVAAGLLMLDPFSKRYVALVLTETLAGFLLLAAAYAFVRAWQEHSLRWWAGAGVALSALVLVRPVFALAVPLAAVGALVAGRGRRRVLAAVAVLGASAALIAPWLGRNWAVAGEPVLGGFGTGLGLLVAAHGEGLGRTYGDLAADPAYLDDFRSVYRLAPPTATLAADPEAHPRYLTRADAALRARAGELLGERLADEPLAVMGEYLYRVYFLWMAHEDWRQPAGGAGLFLLRLVDWTMLAVAAAGAVIAVRRGGAGAALAIFVGLYTLASALIHVEARYTIPLRALYLALVGLALVWTAETVRARRGQAGAESAVRSSR
jgi:hypothetical protein